MTARALPVGGVVAALLLIVVVQAVWFLGQSPLQFADGDSYLRLIRVENLLDRGNWHDVTIARANAPFGFNLHWSRPFDLVLLALALPFVPVLGWHEAILFAGIWISPVLHVATAIVMLWALPPILGRAGACVAAGLTATQVAFLSFAVVERADHHMVFPLVIVMAVGFLARAFESGDKAQAARAGAAIAVGIWIGPEFMVAMAVAIAICGIRWLVDVPGAISVNRGLSIGLAVSLVIALLIERGGQVLAIEYDRLSLFHVTCAAMVLMFWAVIEGAAGRKAYLQVPWRLLSAFFGAALMALVIVVVFPGALGYPFAEVDPAFMRIQSAISDYAGATSPRSVLLYVGPALLALPWAVYRAIGYEQRWSWVLLLAMLAVFVGFTLGWVRWSLYAGTFSVIVLADMLIAADRWLNERFQSPQRILAKLPVIIVLIFGPAAVALAIPSGKAGEGPVACPVEALAHWLDEAYEDGPPRNVLAAANFGPEILYKSRHQVVATLSHRNTDGILDGYRLMISSDLEAVRAMIELRDIDLIAICPDSGAESYIRRDLSDGAFQTVLLSGSVPEGFREVTVTGESVKPFRVFETPRDVGQAQ